MHGFGTEVNQFNTVIDTNFRQGCIGLSVDKFVEVFSPPLPTHVKIDVDGIEPAILRGGHKTFSAPTVRSMSVEVEGDQHSPRSREIMALLADFGFEAKSRASVKSRNVIFDRPLV